MLSAASIYKGGQEIMVLRRRISYHALKKLMTIFQRVHVVVFQRTVST